MRNTTIKVLGSIAAVLVSTGVATVASFSISGGDGGSNNVPTVFEVSEMPTPSLTVPQSPSASPISPTTSPLPMIRSSLVPTRTTDTGGQGGGYVGGAPTRTAIDCSHQPNNDRCKSRSPSPTASTGR